jgi:hypothetical protein
MTPLAVIGFGLCLLVGILATLFLYLLAKVWFKGTLRVSLSVLVVALACTVSLVMSLCGCVGLLWEAFCRAKLEMSDGKVVLEVVTPLRKSVRTWRAVDAIEGLALRKGTGVLWSVSIRLSDHDGAMAVPLLRTRDEHAWLSLMKQLEALDVPVVLLP